MANANARRLRKALTPQEVKVWVHLRSWRPRGFHFRRQVPLHGYIVDFACLRQQIVVEIDGGQHSEEQHLTNDRTRDARLRSDGFSVLRFWNNDVDSNLEGVLAAIQEVLKDPTRLAADAARHPPLAGEG